MSISYEKDGTLSREDFQYFLKEIDPEYLAVFQGPTQLMEVRIDSFTTLVGGVIFRYKSELGPHLQLIPYRRMHFLDVGNDNGKRKLNITLVS